MGISSIQYDMLRQLYEQAAPRQKAKFVAQITNAAPKDKPPSLATVEEYLAARTVVSSCPRCGSCQIVRNGRHNGRQRYRCQACGKTVGLAKDSYLYGTKKPMIAWNTFLRCMFEQRSLRYSAKMCNISLPTAHAWRKKLMKEYGELMKGLLAVGMTEEERAQTDWDEAERKIMSAMRRQCRGRRPQRPERVPMYPNPMVPKYGCY